MSAGAKAFNTLLIIRGIVVYSIVLAVGIFSLFFHFQDNQKDIERLENLSKSGVEVWAECNPRYEETTIKALGVVSKMYTFKYTYKVGNTTYDGEATLDSVLTLPFLKVKYLPERPEISVEGVEKKLAKARERKQSNFLLWVGLAGVAIGGLGLWLTLRRLIRPKNTP